MSIGVRAIQARIGNIENIHQITSAMNAIAMTKVTRMKRQLAASRPYFEGLESYISRLAKQIPDDSAPHPLTMANDSKDTAILVLNSDRGLCGRFKGEINSTAAELAYQIETVKVLAGGEKASTYFGSYPTDVVKSYEDVYEQPTPQVAKTIASDLVSLFEEGQVGLVKVVYMKFVSDLVQRIAIDDVLPITLEPAGEEMLVEPDLPRVLNTALPIYLQGKIFRALLHTKTSEHAIRRQAMKNATDNAEDLIKTLTRSYNRARQQSITREIADIVGGAEALRED